MARAKPGPAKGSVRLTDQHRDKIRNSKILQRLIDFAEGKKNVDMEPHRVTAALGLLKKVMPDMTEATLKGDEDNPLQAVMKINLVGK